MTRPHTPFRWLRNTGLFLIGVAAFIALFKGIDALKGTKLGPIDVGQFLAGTVGVISYLALAGVVGFIAVKAADHWIEKDR